MEGSGICAPSFIANISADPETTGSGNGGANLRHMDKVELRNESGGCREHWPSSTYNNSGITNAPSCTECGCCHLEVQEVIVEEEVPQIIQRPRIIEEIVTVRVPEFYVTEVMEYIPFEPPPSRYNRTRPSKGHSHHCPGNDHCCCFEC